MIEKEFINNILKNGLIVVFNIKFNENKLIFLFLCVGGVIYVVIVFVVVVVIVVVKLFIKCIIIKN